MTFMDLFMLTEVLIVIGALLLVGVLLIVVVVPPRFVVGDYLKDIEDDARSLLASSDPDPEALAKAIDELAQVSTVKGARELRRRLIEKQMELSRA
jgi:hypothetical protein